MKKFYSFLFAAVAVIGFAACDSDIIVETNTIDTAEKMTFVASFDETRTALINGSAVSWSDDDAIAVSDGESVHMFTVKEINDDGTATFEGEAFTSDATTYYAVYPYAEDAVCENGVWNVTVPTEQAFTPGSFAPGAAVSTAESDGTYLAFYNECAILKFQVPSFAEEITSVSINSGSDLDVTMSKMSDEMVSTENFYYVAVTPGEYTFTVRINGYLSKASEKTVYVEKNKIYNLGILPAPEECEWGIVGQHQGWSLSKDNLTRLYKEANNLFVVKNIKLADSGFKFTELTNTNWDLTFGSHSGSYVYSITDGWYAGIYTNNRGDKSNDIKVSDWNKIYDVYLRYVQNASWGKELGFAIVEAGSNYPAY